MNMDEPAARSEPAELPRHQVGKDPSSWVNEHVQAQRDTADRLGITPDLEHMFAKGMTASQVTTALREEGRLGGVPIEEHASLVLGARATLGIPSQADAEGRRDFEAWKAQRDERLGIAAAPPDAAVKASKTTRIDQDAPTVTDQERTGLELLAAARFARQHEEFLRASPRATDDEVSAAKEDRKGADYKPWVHDQEVARAAAAQAPPIAMTIDEGGHAAAGARRERETGAASADLGTTAPTAPQASAELATATLTDAAIEQPPAVPDTAMLELGTRIENWHASYDEGASVRQSGADQVAAQAAPVAMTIDDDARAAVDARRERDTGVALAELGMAPPAALQPLAERATATQADATQHERPPVAFSAAMLELGTRIQNADWYASYSDDSSVRLRGGEQVDAVLGDLKKLAANDRESAQAVWTQFAPKDVPQPEHLASHDATRDAPRQHQDVEGVNSISPLASRCELDAFQEAGKTPESVRQALDAVVGQGSVEGPRYRPIPPLEERFTINRHLLSNDYEFRDQPGKVAFTERLTGLRTQSEAPAAIIGMLDRAAERGWSKVRLGGSMEFKRNGWIAATARGIDARGYVPTRGDQAAALAEKERLAQARDLAEGRVKAAAQRESRPASPERDTAAGIPPDSTHDKAKSFVQGISAAAGVMAALEMALDRQAVRAEQRPAIREAVAEKLTAMQAAGLSAKVRIVDKDAARTTTQAVPAHEHRRASPERSR
ncbi:hypothetical protein HLB44_30785 [Aquincola sp. S2]|uniref:Large polyvalent protein-associated domain-containing protein n=1 Tax=Pseudaquabacterium terrae TaxID=2732868 RepID=A0ABX2ES96_9BURK|nr:LPD7 domain-containing protein [Aquabacterium terrae]NRF71380.1 hypothetical protein [Aquabacterium terrae]